MYFVKEIISGKVHEIVKSYTKNERGPDERHQKTEKTPEEMEAANFRYASKRLGRILQCNFEDGDLWVTLTYKKDRRKSPAESKREFNNFIRRVSYRFKKSGLKCKWVTVTEYESKAIHHHLVINNPDEINVAKILAEQWKQNGIVHTKPLYSNGQYQELADYMVKETKETFRKDDGGRKQRWTCSRNLKKPIVRYRVVKAERWNPQPRSRKGYYIDPLSVVNGVNAYTGREYQSYTMIRLE